MFKFKLIKVKNKYIGIEFLNSVKNPYKIVAFNELTKEYKIENLNPPRSNLKFLNIDEANVINAFTKGTWKIIKYTN